MRENNTHPDIRISLFHVLWHYRQPSVQNKDTYLPSNRVDLDPSVRRCLRAQVTLGWTAFLEGLMVREWSVTQQQYYSRIKSRKQGRRWAINLSKQVWWLVFGMWQHRNDALFSGVCDILSGKDILILQVRHEHRRGMDGLSPVYGVYFRSNIDDLVAGPIEAVKKWLVLIRRGRRAMGFQYNDAISASPELQRWIGLQSQVPDTPANT